MEENATSKFGVWEWFKSIVLIIFIIIVMGILSIYAALSGVFDSIAKPEIKYGEFPLKVTYEVNGEIKVIEEVIVCEYYGMGGGGEGGKQRIWTTHTKDSPAGVVLLEINEYTKLTISYESPEYYMDDLHITIKEQYLEWQRDNTVNRVFYVKTYDEAGVGISAEHMNSEKVYELYSLKLISWEPSPPIQNTYRGPK